MKKLLIAFALLGSLAACAAPARVGAMTADTSPATLIDPASTLNHAIQVGTVSGGEETNPMWKSQVGTPEFQQALTQSLQANSMLATDAPRYHLDANLENLDQPALGGFDMTVGSRIRYKLTDSATGKLAFEKAIETEYTANFTDAFAGVERLRLANEGSIKKNIGLFLEALVQAFKVQPAKTGTPTS